MLKKYDRTRNCRRTSKGFTLLEVMIVISIVSILAGLLIPKFVGYENKAKTVKAINTGKQIYNAVMCVLSDKTNNVTETDISDSVMELTGIDVTDDEDVKKIDDGYEVKFSSDNKEYTLSITSSNGNYVVKDGNKNIFTQGSDEN